MNFGIFPIIEQFLVIGCALPNTWHCGQMHPVDRPNRLDCSPNQVDTCVQMDCSLRLCVLSLKYVHAPPPFAAEHWAVCV